MRADTTQSATGPTLDAAACSAASDWDDDYSYEGPTCGMCGDDGWIMLSDAGPSEWGEDCFCEVDRAIECPECRDRRRYEAFQRKRQNPPGSATGEKGSR